MEGHGRYRRRHLPHWDLPGATYFITACLAGSIPADGLLDLERYWTGLSRLPRARMELKEEWKLKSWKRMFARRDWWLDRHPAVRHFAIPALAKIAVDAILFWAAQRYDLIAYVVMPSHIHWAFKPIVGQVDNLSYEKRHVDNLSHEKRSPRERIMQTLKRHTARECNRELGVRGAFWQDESYDHCVRDGDELERIIEYIEFNPVKAELVDRPENWMFGSAQKRARQGILLGEPIPPK
jgi:putative transposase